LLSLKPAVMPVDSLGFAQDLPDQPAEGTVRLFTIPVVTQKSQPVGSGDALRVGRVVEGGQVLYLPPGTHPLPPVSAVQIGDVDSPVLLRGFFYQQVTEVQIPVIEPGPMHPADQHGKLPDQLPLLHHLMAGEGRDHFPGQVVIQTLASRKLPGYEK
jgi:hypothetical protein